MRVMKNFSKLIFFLGVLAVMLGVPAKTFSASVNLNQSILPVSFVYLDKKGEIEKIWSNISANDNLYVLKFFSAEKNLELPKNQKFISLFQEAVTQKEIFLNGSGSPDHACLSVNFRQDGQILEEIRTYV